MADDLYFRPPNLGPDCSAPRTMRLRERRFAMAYEGRTEPPAYTRLAEEARDIFLAHEDADPSLARALALRHVVEHCEITPEPDTIFLGGENPFFFNLLLPALRADRHSREGQTPPDDSAAALRDAGAYLASCFEGHITPGLDFILPLGITGLRERLTERLDMARTDEEKAFCESALISCESALIYARRYRDEALALAATDDCAVCAYDFRRAAAMLDLVPEAPAETFAEALQSFWLVYILVTLEMGGCEPGGGLGLGRIDQFFLPYYQRDLDAKRLNRDDALELMEAFLLCFRHVDYYTGHQIFTPGSQASLAGVTPSGADAHNDLTELIMEASLRIAMPAPYLSVRLHRHAPERAWMAASNYIAGGLGFPVVNDEVLIPAFVRHGRGLADARDYICSCCYENTIPGRDAFHPNGCYLNLPLLLELALNEGRSLMTGKQLGAATPPASTFATFDDVLAAYFAQFDFVCERLIATVNMSDRSHTAHRRYPLMSVFFDDCIANAKDVCAGGARYNLTGCIVSGLPNLVNSLAAIRDAVFDSGDLAMPDLLSALADNFEGHDDLRRRVLSAPKWANGDDRADDLAPLVTEALYARFRDVVNARGGGRWQVALYSFAANHHLGNVVGASPDGRHAGELLTRNLNPAWGTDRHGPTGVLRSLSRIDFTQFPNGSALDLKFDPSLFASAEGRVKFAGFLKAFVALGVMQMQISMVSTEDLIKARREPSRFPNLMVKVAGYSARFVDIDAIEQEELIRRTSQGL